MYNESELLLSYTYKPKSASNALLRANGRRSARLRVTVRRRFVMRHRTAAYYYVLPRVGARLRVRVSASVRPSYGPPR